MKQEPGRRQPGIPVLQGGEDVNPNLDPLIQSAARTHSLPAALVRAIIAIESDGNPWAVRYEPAFYARYLHNKGIKGFAPCSDATEARLRAHSFGLMQIMGATARETGFRETFLTALCDPEVGLEWGSRYLSGLLKKYGNLEAAVAAYNAGSPRKTNNGKWVNQGYVDKIRRAGGLP